MENEIKYLRMFKRENFTEKFVPAEIVVGHWYYFDSPLSNQLYTIGKVVEVKNGVCKCEKVFEITNSQMHRATCNAKWYARLPYAVRQ